VNVPLDRCTPQKHPSYWKNILGGIGETCSGKAPLGLRKHPRGAIEQRITKDQR